jgi:hypothetical protein
MHPGARQQSEEREGSVPHEDLRSQPIEQVLEQVKREGSVELSRSVATLAARCTIEVANSLNQLWGGLFDIKKSLAERLGALTSELEESRSALSAASAQAAKHTEAFVRWTKVLVLVTCAYTLITGGLLIVAIVSVLTPR